MKKNSPLFFFEARERKKKGKTFTFPRSSFFFFWLEKQKGRARRISLKVRESLYPLSGRLFCYTRAVL